MQRTPPVPKMRQTAPSVIPQAVILLLSVSHISRQWITPRLGPASTLWQPITKASTHDTTVCVCPAAIPTLCLLLQCSLLEVLTQQSQLQLHRQITSKPRNRLCKRSNFLQHKKLSLRGKLPDSFAHPFFPLFSFPKCRSWKGIHSSGMSTGIYSFQFVSQMTKCYWLNLHLLALPGPLSDTQVYKVISSSFYKSRFMSLSLLFSMKWLCRFFPFIPLSHLDYFYSPPLSHLRNFTSLSGSPCRTTLYSPAPIQTTILTPTR